MKSWAYYAVAYDKDDKPIGREKATDEEEAEALCGYWDAYYKQYGGENYQCTRIMRVEENEKEEE